MLFDTAHILYLVISSLAIASLLVLFFYTVKNEKWKEIILKVIAIITVFLHYLPLFYDYLTKGRAYVDATQLFPIFPCNLAMWLLLIVSLLDKKSKVFKVLAEFLFYYGFIGGLFGNIFNVYYKANPTLLNVGTFKSLLSHSFLMLGSLYLGVGKFIQIRVKNIVSGLWGFMIVFLDAWFVITIFALCGRTVPNAMGLIEPYFPSLPWFNTYFIAILGLVVVFIFTAIYEQIVLKKEDRWYYPLQRYLENRKQKKDENKN